MAMRRRTRAATAASAVVVLAAGALALRAARDTPSASSATPTTTAAAARRTATVTRRDLVATTNVSGTVTYGNPRALRVGRSSSSSNSAGGNGGSGSSGSGSSASGSGSGDGTAATPTTPTTPTTTTTTASAANIITALPAVGAVLDRGQTVFELDGAPGPALLFGPRPMWRTLQVGVTNGLDVAQLELNLAALGFTDSGAMTIDQIFTSATATAVADWQQSRGLARTGIVAPSDVVVQPGPVRVASLSAATGDSASGEIMQVTDTTRRVYVALDPANEAFVKIGGRVGITLPDNRVVQGRVQSIGTVANSSGGGGNNQSTTTTVDLWITLAKPPANLLDNSPVVVQLVTSRAVGVLAVPVTALLALTEGGYGLEVVQPDGTTKLVGVRTGKFAGGWVEVQGALAAGDRVVTA